jgi:hypothetical protein
MKLQTVSQKTIRKYIIKLADIVGLKIKKSIRRGCCVADGWSCGLIHYVAISHFWLDSKIEKKVWKVFVRKALLAIAPLLDETSLDALSCINFIWATYELYDPVDKDANLDSGSEEENNSIRLVAVLTLDNSTTNQSTAQRLHVPMVGCHAHRYNLALKKYTVEADDGQLQVFLDRVHACMKKVSNKE